MTNRPTALVRRCALCVLVLFAATSSAARAAVPGAEIVLVVGAGDRKDAPAVPWVPAKVSDKVSGGGFVRTQSNSQMGLLFADRTQLRLNQNSQLEIKTFSEANQWTQTTVKLNAGRAWSQARPQTAPAGAPRDARLVMETPTATMSIRGTDWDVEVGPDGVTTLVVLSGVVNISNPQGSLDVAKGEAAIAMAGKAPERLTLVNPKSRVQWVSTWRPDPRRWVRGASTKWESTIKLIETGDLVAAIASLRTAAAKDADAASLLADLLMYQGETDAAIDLLTPFKDQASQQQVTLLAYALTRADRMSEAIALLDASLMGNASPDLWIAKGELLSLDGDAKGAGKAFEHVRGLGDSGHKAGGADAYGRALLGLAIIAAEATDLKRARPLFEEVLRQPSPPGGAEAELAAAESLAGDFSSAAVRLAQVLKQDPSNYVALTALGINQLKQGQSQEALESFLKAGLIEPRYARAWLYSGIAFYQVGERVRALDAMRRAAELDSKDPLPHFLQSMVEGDALDFAAAASSARAAQAKMPFLKSLNQLANDQKGSANLGRSLAQWGLEAWAGYYADQAYSPYWGGSHLFLADRYTGKYSKNSELMKGFLTDPMNFGASNRESSLIVSPGHYGRVDLVVDRKEWLQFEAIATANGMSVQSVPIAYFVSGDWATADSRLDASDIDGSNYTIGLGLQPRFDLGVFTFLTDTRIASRIRSASFPSGEIDQAESRGDIGFNYKISPSNQIWVKVGAGGQDNAMSGTLVSADTANELSRVFAPAVFSAMGVLEPFRSEVSQRDVQLRQTMSQNDVIWTWGVERSTQDRNGRLVTLFAPVQFDFEERFSLKSTDVYATSLFPIGASVAEGKGYGSVELGVFFQKAALRRHNITTIDHFTLPLHLVTEDTDLSDDASEWNVRAGVSWHPTTASQWRAVHQQWRRPASASSLAPIQTLGIAVSDRLPMVGGEYRRTRLQYDIELSASTFWQAFLDHESIDNGIAGRRTTISDFEVSQLEDLRNRGDVFAARPSLEDTPIFVKGKVSTFGSTINYMMNDAVALSAGYLNRNSEQGADAAHRKIPLVPRHETTLGVRWNLSNRIIVGGTAVYRSQRFADDAGAERLDAGWNFATSGYWESANKKYRVQALAENLLPTKSVGLRPSSHVTLRVSYFF